MKTQTNTATNAEMKTEEKTNAERHGVVQELRARVSDEADTLAKLRTDIEDKEANGVQAKTNANLETESTSTIETDKDSDHGKVETENHGQLELRAPELKVKGSDEGSLKLGL